MMTFTYQRVEYQQYWYVIIRDTVLGYLSRISVMLGRGGAPTYMRRPAFFL